MIKGQILIDNKFKLLGLSALLIALSGCGVHKASFDCAGSKGMGCGSMIGVHKAIKDNEFLKESDHKQLSKGKTNNVVLVKEEVGSALQSNGAQIYRSQDKIMRIWFNGYFDQQNNFHDSQYVYTIIAPAEWVVAR